jgi:regulatory protein
MHRSYTIEEAKKKLEYYCAYQERCHDEAIQKLRELHMIPQAIDVVMAHLINNNFLNEERFACSFARGRFRIKQWGKVRIVNELKARNISNYNIDKALKEIGTEEYLEAFGLLFEKEWGQSSEKDPQKKKKKILDLLLRKGYEISMVMDRLYAQK